MKQQHCTTRTITGTASFTTTARAKLIRSGVTYATGVATRAGLTLHAVRRARAGRYTLTLIRRQGRRTIVTRRWVTVR